MLDEKTHWPYNVGRYVNFAIRKEFYYGKGI